MKLIVLTTTYNCENYINKCLSSIMSQTYKNFECYITDDLSTDGTVTKIKNFIKNDDRFVLIENSTKHYQPGNYDQVIRGEYDVKDDDIWVRLMGTIGCRIQKHSKELLTHIHPEMCGYQMEVLDITMVGWGLRCPHKDFTDIRQKSFTLTHLRTWKSFLWKQIKQEDLKDENGEYWCVAGDLSFMFPMVEMCGPEHYKFMNEINYIYNESNPLNDHKVNMFKVNEIVGKIRNKTPYSKL